MGEWQDVKLGDLLKRSKISIDINDDEVYKRVTIRTKHKGVSARDIVLGKLIGTKKQFILKSGQFVMSKIDARYGAFGIAENNVNDSIITGNFWAYNINENLATVEWITDYTNSPEFYELCERASSGITHRKYLNEKMFLNHRLLIPSIKKQMVILENLKANKYFINKIKQEIFLQSSYLTLLRQSILQDAIEGKLTAVWRKNNSVCKGDPKTDASALLEKVKAEKKRLIAEGKIKKDKPLPFINTDEVPFDLPESWVWCRLGEIIELISGQHIESNNTNTKNKGKPYITGPADFGELHPKITRWTEYPKVVALKNDLLITVKGSGVGKTNLLDIEEVVISRQLMAIRPLFSHMLRFICHLMAFRRNEIQNAKDGLIPGISREYLLYFVCPLPPLAEQYEIVRRVDKLLAIVDEMEKQVAERKEKAERLMQAVLREAFEENN